MAWTATSKPRNAKRGGGGDIVAYRMTASTTIYKGDIVRIDKTAGTVTGALATGSMATGDVFAGIAAETKTSGATILSYINVYTSGIFEFNTLDTAALTDIGKVVYQDTAGATADGSYCILTAGGGHDMEIGTCIDFPSTSKRLVRINGYAGHAGNGVAD